MNLLREAKKNLEPLWERVGLKGRVMCVAGDRTYLSVIEVKDLSEPKIPSQEDIDYARKLLRSKAVKEAYDYADATRGWFEGFEKMSSDIPVMG